MVEEAEYVDHCKYCDADFVGVTPDEAREHIVEEHTPLGKLFVWPTPEYKEQTDWEVLNA